MHFLNWYHYLFSEFQWWIISIFFALLWVFQNNKTTNINFMNVKSGAVDQKCLSFILSSLIKVTRSYLEDFNFMCGRVLRKLLIKLFHSFCWSVYFVVWLTTSSTVRVQEISNVISSYLWNIISSYLWNINFLI